MGKGILVITFVLQQINLTGYILPPRKSVSLSPCTYIIASLSKPLDKESDWTGLLGMSRSESFQLSFHILWHLVTAMVSHSPDHTPIHCTQLFFVAHRTWPLRWLQVTLVKPSVFKVHSPVYACKPLVWSGKLNLRTSAKEATHTPNSNFITA